MVPTVKIVLDTQTRVANLVWNTCEKWKEGCYGYLVESYTGTERHQETLHGKLVHVCSGKVGDEDVPVVDMEPPEVVHDAIATCTNVICNK